MNAQDHPADRRLPIVAAPPLDRTVPAELREHYAEAPELTERKLIRWAYVALLKRADRAHAASQELYAAAHVGADGRGRYLFTDERPAHDEILWAGLTPEDFADGQHLQRLAHARRAAELAGIADRTNRTPTR